MFRFLFQTIPLSLLNLVRLALFVVCLFPGFLRFAWYYFIAADRVSVTYGNESIRQTLDVYRTSCPQDSRLGQALLLAHENSNGFAGECRSNAPVLVFCTGGAWMIGYKMWGALLARALTATGVVVVIPDLRNYPFVYIPGMVDDVDLAIDWTKKNVAQYGGDPNNIVLVGQSAGGHVACMALFRKIRELVTKNETTYQSSPGVYATSVESKGEWIPSDLKGFAAISSPLNLGSVITESFERLGFDQNMVDRMFGFDKDNYDPFLLLQEFQSSEFREKFLQELPPIRIYQGTEDKTVPKEVSESFYDELKTIVLDASSVSYVSYAGWSHTDPILEGPMDADHRLHKDLLQDVNEWTASEDLGWSNDPGMNARLCPHFLVEFARLVNPF